MMRRDHSLSYTRGGAAPREWDKRGKGGSEAREPRRPDRRPESNLGPARNKPTERLEAAPRLRLWRAEKHGDGKTETGQSPVAGRDAGQQL